MNPLCTLSVVIPSRGLAELRAIYHLIVKVSVARSRLLPAFLSRHRLNFLSGNTPWYTPKEALGSTTSAADLDILLRYWWTKLK